MALSLSFRRPLWAFTALACLAAPLLADDKPPQADKQAQTAAAAVGHLCTQRPEGVLAAILVAGRREVAGLGAMEFIALDTPVQGSVAATSMIGVRNGTVAIALYRHGLNNGMFIID